MLQQPLFSSAAVATEKIQLASKDSEEIFLVKKQTNKQKHAAVNPILTGKIADIFRFVRDGTAAKRRG